MSFKASSLFGVAYVISNRSWKGTGAETVKHLGEGDGSAQSRLTPFIIAEALSVSVVTFAIYSS